MYRQTVGVMAVQTARLRDGFTQKQAEICIYRQTGRIWMYRQTDRDMDAQTHR